METRSTVSTRLAFGVLAALFAWQLYQSATLPILPTEAALYDRFVRPSARQILVQELPNRDVLYSLLEKRSVGLFHVSPFAVRLPGLTFLLLCFWSIWQLARQHGTGLTFLLATVFGGLLAVTVGAFGTATGIGMAFTLQILSIQLFVLGKLNLSGVSLGLSVAARWDFAISAVVIALAFLTVLTMQRRWREWSDRVLIPSLVVALIFLVLPLSHAHASPAFIPDQSTSSPAHLQLALQALRNSAGTSHVRIGVSPIVEPVLNFYRAQHRAKTWERADPDLNSAAFDYYLLSVSDARLIDQRHLIVLYRDMDFIVAGPGHDGL